MEPEEQVEEFFAHFGVKGMHWGIRKDHLPGVSAKTNREAKKDAGEFARAKMFYGQGAGTRRKLIKGTVDAKAKRDPNYAKAFDHHLANQDMSNHASGARKERTRTDRKEKTSKRAGYVARRLTGEMGTQAAFTAAAIGGAAFLNSGRGRQTLNRSMQYVKDGKADFIRKRGAKHINDLIKNMG